MVDAPWTGDACSLVDAFRAGDRHPVEELRATLGAIERSELNAICYLDAEAALTAAANADVTLPFGGVPIAVKELDAVAGWPYTHASVPLADQIADHTSTMVQRLRQRGGAVTFGQTTASEFGGVNVTRTKLHGVTRNPWDSALTPGGSSGGSAAGVSGGLMTLATAGDGGGSIRIPAGFCGLVGLKGTAGRIPLGPQLRLGNLTTVIGCVSRSVRDTARWFDITNGFDPRDPLSLPAVSGWEEGLGSHGDELRGLRVAVVDDWGGAYVAEEPWALVDEIAAWLVDAFAWRRVDVDTSLPRVGQAWSLSGMLGIMADLGDRWPACAADLTGEMRNGLKLAAERYGTEARVKIEERRTALNEAMARIFDEVDLVVTASNPDIAFPAEGPLPSVFGGREIGAGNNGRLTFPANMYGCPAVSIPAGTCAGLPVGLQVVGRHFTEPLLLNIAYQVEQARPWPLLAPGTVAG